MPLPRALVFALLVSACGGAGAAPAASAGGERPTPRTAVNVLEIHPCAISVGPDVALRLHADGTLEGRNVPRARLLPDGHIAVVSGEPLPFEVNAAGEVRVEGEIVARIEGTRMTFAGESSTSFEYVPGAVQLFDAGEVVERLTVEGDPPGRTVLFLTVLVAFANGAVGP